MEEAVITDTVMAVTELHIVKTEILTIDVDMTLVKGITGGLDPDHQTIMSVVTIVTVAETTGKGDVERDPDHQILLRVLDDLSTIVPFL